MIGSSVGRYRVTGRLGSGGMGEVYEAEDPSLGRVVALKVLPPEVANDRERHHRFEREAKAIAALDHPGIVTVYAVEEHDGRLCLVMERIRGRTLAELLPSSGFPFEKVIELAVPLVAAVAAAHARGIVHRDLKPQNVMVTDEGRLKVLDFGIARRESTGDNLAHTATATAEGKVIGTVAYMSPEQARGLKVDERSDLFSLGVVLFELATGKRPFSGEGIDLAMAIVSAPAPAPSSLVPPLPKAFDALVLRCLEKEPARRWASAAELERALEALRSTHPSPPLRTPISRRGIGFAALAVALAMAVAAVWRWRPAPAASPRIVKLTQLTFDPAREDEPSLAPDGSWLVYTRHGEKQGDLHRLRVGGENSMNLTADSPDDDHQASISPDGQQIAFRSERQGGGLFLMGATGESVRRLTDGGYYPSWSPDGREVLYSTQWARDPRVRPSLISEVWAVTVDTGQKRRLREADAVQPVLSPHGKRIAFWGVRTHGRDLMTAAPDGSDLVQLTDDVATEWSPSWSGDGRWLYFASNRGGGMNLWRFPVDESRGRARGAPEMITTDTAAWSFSPQSSIDGARILYVSGRRLCKVEKIAFDPVKETTEGRFIHVSDGLFLADADGEWLYGTLDALGEDLVMVRTDGTSRRRLTDDALRQRHPRLSPDGKTLVFQSFREGANTIFTIHTDGSGLTAISPPGNFVSPLWSPDGKRLAFTDVQRNLFIVDAGRPWSEQQPEKLQPMADPKLEFRPLDWSPDGRFIVGDVAAPGGRGPLWIYDLKERRARNPVPDGRVVSAQWIADGKQVLYASGREVWVLDVASGKSRSILTMDEDVAHALLSPDRRWLYLERFIRQGDLWMAELR